MAIKNIGAFWEKQSKAGVPFLSGEIELTCEHCQATQKHRLTAFLNKRKKEEKHPNFNIVQFDDDGQWEGRAKTKQALEGSHSASQDTRLDPTLNREMPNSNDEIRLEDIPF